MQKPIVVARQEFLNDVVTLINKYGQQGLPMFVVSDILTEVTKEVQIKAQEQYDSAKAQYEAALAEEATKETESKTKKK